MNRYDTDRACVSCYLDLFEKMALVLWVADQEDHKRCPARCRAILSDLLKLLRMSERRLNREEIPNPVDDTDWAFQFEVMIHRCGPV